MEISVQVHDKGSFNFMAAVTIYSDFEAQENKIKSVTAYNCNGI